MQLVAEKAEVVNGPMARAARAAMDWNTNLQNLAVHMVDDLARSIADVAAGTKTASEAFREMAASILRDLGQMIIKAALWRAVSGFMGGGSTGGAPVGVVGAAGSMPVPTFRASGGPVSSGAPYIVGERGPELFVPDLSGRIVSNKALAGSSVTVGGTTINIQGSADQATLAPMKQELARRDAELPARVVAAVRDGRSRRAL